METVINQEVTDVVNGLKIIDELRCSNEAKDHQIKLLEEKIHYLLHARFGRKSERSNEHQGSLFEDDVEKTEEAINPSTDVQIPAHSRKGGRRIPSKDLPHIRVEHDLSEDEKVCVCHHSLNRSGEEISYQYDVIPAKFQVIEHARIKYVCSNPACEHSSKIAKQDPPAPLPRTQASAGLLAWIGTSKFVDGMPLNRIAHVAEHRFAVPFNSTTLSAWMIKGAERIIAPIVGALEEEFYRCDYAQVDETTFQVLNEKGREAKQKSYIWCRVTGAHDRPIVLMDYSPGRAGAVASQLLAGFAGYLQTDGYCGYNAVALRDDITQLGCWAHTRRKFLDAQKHGCYGATLIAEEGVKLIRELYHLDRLGQKKAEDQRTSYRQTVMQAHLDKIRTWIDDNQGRAVSYAGLLATAFTYIHNQWSKLIVFVEDFRLCLDNNKAERHIRPIALGRKVWLFAQSEPGARATALWYSLVETAKANGIEPYWYLRKVFEEMPVYLRDDLPVEDLLPWNFKNQELNQSALHA